MARCEEQVTEELQDRVKALEWRVRVVLEALFWLSEQSSCSEVSFDSIHEIFFKAFPFIREKVSEDEAMCTEEAALMVVDGLKKGVLRVA